jgi:hypothetical protein
MAIRKRDAVDSASERWTGMGVVAALCAVVLIMQGPHLRHEDTHWKTELLHILQELSGICKTRSKFYLKHCVAFAIFFVRAGMGSGKKRGDSAVCSASPLATRHPGAL